MVSTWGIVISMVNTDMAPSTRLNSVSERAAGFAASGCMAPPLSIRLLVVQPHPGDQLADRPYRHDRHKDGVPHAGHHGVSEHGEHDSGQCKPHSPRIRPQVGAAYAALKPGAKLTEAQPAAALGAGKAERARQQSPTRLATSVSLVVCPFD